MRATMQEFKEAIELFEHPERFLEAFALLSIDQRCDMLQRLMVVAKEQDLDGMVKMMHELMKGPPPVPAPAPLTDEQFANMQSHPCLENHGHPCGMCLLLGEVKRLRQHVELESWGGEGVLKMAREVINQQQRLDSPVTPMLVFARAVVRLATGRDWDM